jgi:hypothetical protein
MPDQTPEEKAAIDAFVAEYNALCKKHGYQIDFQPQWKRSADTGTWSMVLVPMLVKISPLP